jgi:formylglycine-generating enzyme required for sulfatase activity
MPPSLLILYITTSALVGDPEGMVWIPATDPAGFVIGAVEGDSNAKPDESPRKAVILRGFWMDRTEVTNAQFEAFVKATGYVTTAEKPVNWEELKKQLPDGTPKPSVDQLAPGSLVFTPPDTNPSLRDVSHWWSWVHGASWRHPEGPGSSITGKMNHPVVQISHDDAVAFAKWAGKRLPSEAEWEYAARAGDGSAIYPWGTESNDAHGVYRANLWQGNFPSSNDALKGGGDKYDRTAPVASFNSNAFGLYDMSGNVWEWCADWYRPDSYTTIESQSVNPKGPQTPFDPDEPLVPKRVMRGGSFLCNDSYCTAYRSTARMKSSPDSSLSHAGFRCVSDAPPPHSSSGTP